MASLALQDTCASRLASKQNLAPASDSEVGDSVVVVGQGIEELLADVSPPTKALDVSWQEQLVLNLDDGPSLILGPIPIERRVPITRGDVNREVEVQERVRLEMERAQALFAGAFSCDEW